MPSNYGSSRILNISGVSGLTGPTGAYGPTGPTGHTGEAGVTGPTGVMGTGIIPGPSGASGGDGTRYFLDGEFGGDFITLFLTDGTTLGFSGARGATGVDVSDDYQILNDEHPDYAQLYSTKSGSTAYFKSLTVSGRDVEVFGSDDFTVLLRGSTYTHGIFGNTGELIHTRDGFTAWGIPNTYWSGSELYARILTHREIKNRGHWSTGVTANNNLILNPTNTDEIVSSGSVDGKGVPFSVLGEVVDEPNKVSLKVGTHFGQTGSTDIKVRYSGITFEKDSVNFSPMGSCCYCQNNPLPQQDDNPNCVDYSTEDYCNSVGGIFSLASCIDRPEGPDCYATGSCCINGVCVATSMEKCSRYGGFFVEGMPCEGPNSIESLGGCPEPCGDRGSCCIDQMCFEFTEYECSFIHGGFFVDSPCDEVDCCINAPLGACCINEMCYDTTPYECSKLQAHWEPEPSRGIYWGIGSKCAGPYGPYRPYGDEQIDATEDINNVPLISCAECEPVEGEPLPYPPCRCAGYNGWFQESGPCVDIDGDPVNICACENISCQCPCKEEGGCGTIILADGNCWSCCRDEPTYDDGGGGSEPTGACCFGTGGEGCQDITRTQCVVLGGYFIEDTACSDDPFPCFFPPLGSCCVDGVCLDYYTPLQCAEANGLYMRDGSICNKDLSCPYCHYIVSKTGLPNGTTRFNKINDAVTAVDAGTYNQVICVEEGEWDGFNSNGYGDPHQFLDTKMFEITSTDPHNQQVVENTIITKDPESPCGSASFYSGGGQFNVSGLTFRDGVRCGFDQLDIGEDHHWDDNMYRIAIIVNFSRCRFGPVDHISGGVCPGTAGMCSAWLSIESAVNNHPYRDDAYLAQSVNVHLSECVIDGDIWSNTTSGISLSYPQLPGYGSDAYWYDSGSWEGINPSVGVSLFDTTIININANEWECAGIQHDSSNEGWKDCYDISIPDQPRGRCLSVRDSTICDNAGNNITGPWRDMGGNTIQDQCP